MKQYSVNHKRVLKLMQIMDLQAIYAKPRTTILEDRNPIFPYLLRDVVIQRPNQAWASDITYLRLQEGFMYLIAIMDLFSRFVLSWKLSNSLDKEFCLLALEEALQIASPEIFNTDRGGQFTSNHWLNLLITHGVRISMNGQGRCIDNVYPERLWRTIKYEDVYLKAYENGWELNEGLEKYLAFYNYERYHQSLKYRTPAEVYFNGSHGS